jgi:hypothetical protein
MNPVYSTSEKYVIVCYDVYVLNLKTKDLIDEPLLFCKHERPKTMISCVDMDYSVFEHIFNEKNK